MTGRLLRAGAKAALLVVLVLLAGIGLAYVARTPPVRRVAVGEGLLPAVSEPRFHALLELLAGLRLEPGHEVELLQDGDGTFPLLWRDLAEARASVTVQIYFAEEGEIAARLGELLAARARAGARVLVLLDAVGSSRLPAAWDEALRAAGARVERFRPVRWYELEKATHRGHSRGVVVDGRIGYTGGFGIADKWKGSGRSEREWRETNVRFVGEAALALQAEFAAAWTEATGELLVGDELFPPHALERAAHELPSPAPGGVVAGLLSASPRVGSTPAERFLALAAAAARERLWIANSYFVPRPDLQAMLAAAVARGVDVRVLTHAGPRSDLPLTWRAGRGTYEPLLAAGVRIWEYRPAMMHAKALVVDGALVAVGSMNLDNRSIALNQENLLVAVDPLLGAGMEDVFRADLALSDEVELARYRLRPWHERARERLAGVLRRLL